MPEVLEHIVVFTGDCDNHGFSLGFKFGRRFARTAAEATGGKAAASRSGNGVSVLRDCDAPPGGQGQRDPAVRRVEQPLERAARDLHMLRRLRLVELLQVDQPERLKFIQPEFDGGLAGSPLKYPAGRAQADFTAFGIARHGCLL